MTGPEPRLPPLPADEWDETITQALSPLLPAENANPDFAGNILGTLVRHRELTHAYLTFNAHLLRQSTLTPRQREVAVLRAALASRSEYLWDHHVPLALRVGLTEDDIERVRTGTANDPADALIVRAVDEMAESSTLSDDAWERLRGLLDERQVLDLIFTVGCYQVLAVAINTLRIQPEQH